MSESLVSYCAMADAIETEVHFQEYNWLKAGLRLNRFAIVLEGHDGHCLWPWASCPEGFQHITALFQAPYDERGCT